MVICLACIVVCFVIYRLSFFFFFNDTATTEIYTLSLHDALPISAGKDSGKVLSSGAPSEVARVVLEPRSEEHTSELQSRLHLVCRLLLEKKKKKINKMKRAVTYGTKQLITHPCLTCTRYAKIPCV